jgi:hypothetical protein
MEEAMEHELIEVGEGTEMLTRLNPIMDRWILCYGYFAPGTIVMYSAAVSNNRGIGIICYGSEQ